MASELAVDAVVIAVVEEEAGDMLSVVEAGSVVSALVAENVLKLDG